MGIKIIEVPWDTLCNVAAHKDRGVLEKKGFIDIEEVEVVEYFWRANKIIEEFQNEDKESTK